MSDVENRSSQNRKYRLKGSFSARRQFLLEYENPCVKLPCEAMNKSGYVSTIETSRLADNSIYEPDSDFNTDQRDGGTSKEPMTPVKGGRARKIVLGLFGLTALLEILWAVFKPAFPTNDFEYIVISETDKTIAVTSVEHGRDYGSSSVTIPDTKDGYTVIAILNASRNDTATGWGVLGAPDTVHVPDTVRYIATQSYDITFIVNDTNPYISISDRLLFNRDKTELITCLYLERYWSFFDSAGHFKQYKAINSIFIPSSVEKINDVFKTYIVLPPRDDYAIYDI